MANSTYVRLHAGDLHPRVIEVDTRQPAIFVDVEVPLLVNWEDAVADRLRVLSEHALSEARYILVRAPEQASLEALDHIATEVTARTGREARVGQVEFAVGVPPEVLWGTAGAPPDTAARILGECRSLELAALLQNGDAHWRPRTYHFELPSGEHRADFIRVGDAFRHPRDAEALATWLYPLLETGRSVLLDTSSLMPLAVALRAAAREAGVSLGPLAVRDDYPGALLRDEELIELTVGANGAIAVLSVSSTGQTARNLGAALQRRGLKWWLETLVERSPATDPVYRELAPRPRQGLAGPWINVPEPEPPDHDDEVDACGWCARSSRAPYVRIDPSSFANTMLPEPAVKAMPDAPHADRTLDVLLEMYDRVEGIGIDCRPSSRTRMRRGNARVGIRFYPDRLLEDDRFLQAVAQQLSAPTSNWRDGRQRLDSLQHLDSMVFLQTDYDQSPDRFDALLTLVEQMFGDPHASTVRVGLADNPTKTQSQAEARALRDSKRIVIVTLGTVTGGTLQELLVRVHSLRGQNVKLPYEVAGLTIHARPPSFREWRSTLSSFYERLVACWITYLPATDHPFRNELRLLGRSIDDDRLSSDAQAWVEERLSQVIRNDQPDWSARLGRWDPDGGRMNPAAALICSDSGRRSPDLPRLLPNSRFGDRMSMIGTLAGIGVTLHRARLDNEELGGPPGLRFDLTRIPVVYFETPIIASVLRWLRPAEAFWEYTGRTAEDVVRDMWERAAHETPGSRITLLGELLIGAASGVVPAHTESLLRELAEDLRSSCSAAVFAPIEAGLALIDEAWPSVATDARDEAAGAS